MGLLTPHVSDKTDEEREDCIIEYLNLLKQAIKEDHVQPKKSNAEEQDRIVISRTLPRKHFLFFELFPIL